jgi:two-component system, OmpR family, heavy metal sensor histidine kinase CusS
MSSRWRRFRRGRPSIARRLALLHIVAVLISYTVFGLLFYAKRIDQRQQRAARELGDEVISVKTMLRQPNGMEIVKNEVLTQRFEPDRSRMWIRVLDRDGTTLMETPGMTEVLPPAVFSAIKLRNGNSFSTWRSGNGDHFDLMSAPLPDELPVGPGCRIELASSANQFIVYRAQLRWSLVAFVGSGVIFAFVCGYFIVRYGLKPLEEISATAASITRRDLHTRISDDQHPRELLPLVRSFNSMLARLEDSFGRLSHYSANLAHELRTPINTMMIAADIALSRERSAEEYRGVLASNQEELRRMSATIERLLLLARADLEQPDLALQRLDVAAEVEDLFDYYSDAAREAGVTLERVGDAAVAADEALFRRALSNLISNSLAYTPPGGVIEVACRDTAEGMVEVTVRDSGSGIDPEHLPRIFDRFYRAAGSGANACDGTGLGLAIVKAIMQMHSGSVAIRSAPGAGTEVTLTFPAAGALLGKSPAADSDV